MHVIDLVWTKWKDLLNRLWKFLSFWKFITQKSFYFYVYLKYAWLPSMNRKLESELGPCPAADWTKKVDWQQYLTGKWKVKRFIWYQISSKFFIEFSWYSFRKEKYFPSSFLEAMAWRLTAHKLFRPELF